MTGPLPRTANASSTRRGRHLGAARPAFVPWEWKDWAISSPEDTATVAWGHRDRSEDFSDEELAALALSADPAEALDEGAIPIDVFLGTASPPLPLWYMAPARARCTGRVARAVVLMVVGAFLLIEAFGLCSTYGQPPFH